MNSLGLNFWDLYFMHRDNKHGVLDSLAWARLNKDWQPDHTLSEMQCEFEHAITERDRQFNILSYSMQDLRREIDNRDAEILRLKGQLIKTIEEIKVIQGWVCRSKP